MKEKENETQNNLNNLGILHCVEKYTPFNFKFNYGLRVINPNLKKYYAFEYYENSKNNNSSKEKEEEKKSKENEGNLIKEESKENNDNAIKINNINKNEGNINTSYNSNNLNHPNINNLDKLIDIEEDDENEYIESEQNREEEDDYHSYSEDDFVVVDFPIREDNGPKILIINIIKTYNKIDPNYKYQINQEEEKIILTDPSEGVNNNGKDNKDDDLIVCKEDEIKNEEKKTNYIIKSLLGTGVSGQAFKAFCTNDNNYYALKIIKRKEVLKKKSLFEIKILKLLNEKDPNDQFHIIRLYDFFVYNGHLCIVIELLQKTLLELLEMNNQEGISLNSIRYILKQILKSVDYIHSLKIVHTDLKPENILLSVYKGENNEGNSNLNLSNLNNQKNNHINNNTSGMNINNISNRSLINKRVTIKIADFGAALPLKHIYYNITIQSLYYRAPEVILYNNPRSEKIDIWSIGCILGELYLGTPLMPGNSNYDQLNKINILIGEIPQNMIEHSIQKDNYFKKDNTTYNYRIRKPEEYYKENPKIPKSEYEIPKNMKNIDDLINVKKDVIKSKNSLHKSMHNSSLSLNSSNTKEDLVAFIHLMKGMLQIDPKKRWSCKQCLKHPFLTKEKLDKFISFELNEINQFMSNSFNSNNSFNFQNNNCHSMNINNSFNKFQQNRGGNINNNNTFYGGHLMNNRNNYSFGIFNNNNFNYRQYAPYPQIFPPNININNINYQNNNFNNNYQNNINNYQGNNINYNQRMNSSFSYNINNINMMHNNYPFQFNFIPNRNLQQNFFPNPNIPYNNLGNNFANNINNNINPIFNNYNNQIRHNKTYIGDPTEKLNTSYNSNISKNSKSNKKANQNNHLLHKNKKNLNPQEFLFNKENIILGNFEDNKQDPKRKEEIKAQPQKEYNKIITKDSPNENENQNLKKLDNNNEINPEIDKNNEEEEKK